ncbi:hypothetical protein MMYC01_200804 [Madurella mycetomatis]|uniref:Myb-like domain-containing protein n=1 Tax=Madurella mycetomatis TaxID=100816 RepID=A0A175WFS6_9PEZI|nr:hypothetical protein MMYC01_200804 [Madurella mycetomatis]
MSGRGRGRPPSRSAQEPTAGPSRRSTRQQQNNTAPPEQEAQPPQQQQQEEQDQLPGLGPAPRYHEIIDPAITGSQDGSMLPPPVPSSKGMRGQMPQVARRGTRRDARASSMASINSLAVTDAYSSQAEPQKAVTASAFGTPARATSIISELDDTPSRKAARSRLMESMLPRLFTASDDLFAHLCEDPVDAEMWEAERGGFKDAFDAYRARYVPDISNPVVDPAYVADTMRLLRGSPMWHSVFRTVSAANLTSLLDEISSIHQQDPLPLLQAWDSVFPDFFVREDPDSNDDEINDFIEQVLTIRTQLSIFTLQKLQTESPAPFHAREHVAKIWCDGNVSVEAVEAFLADNNDALQLKPIITGVGLDAHNLARDRTVTRFTSICKILPNTPVGGHTLDLGQIYETYPFEEFVVNLRDFVKRYFKRIKTSLQQGSASRDSLLPFAASASEASSRVDSQIRSQLETDAMAHAFDRAEPGDPSLSYNMDALRRMKQLEQQGPAVYDDGTQPAPGSYHPAPRIPYPPGFSSSPTGMLYAESAHQGGFQSNGSMYAESAAQVSGRKRHGQNETSGAGDEAIDSSAPPAKKPRVRRKKSTAAGSTAAPPATVPATAPAGPIAHTQYPPLPGTQDEPDLDALRERTKEISAATRKAREPQVRSAWVRNDVKLLVKAVDTYACKWSTIEKEIKAGTIPFERPRDQQALRDKARLLKQDFLKADANLPPGFDLVVLGKKEREAVMAVGKNPERKEADVDEAGRPINTELAPQGMPALPAPAPLSAPEPEMGTQPEAQAQVPGPEPAVA